MKEGKFILGKYIITSNTSYDILCKEEFEIIELDEDYIYISKEPIKIKESIFWVTMYFDANSLKRIELCNAEEKFEMNSSTLKSSVIEELKVAHDDFLQENLGRPDKKNISSIEYVYEWGKIISYYDNKSGECGIVIDYL